MPALLQVGSKRPKVFTPPPKKGGGYAPGGVSYFKPPPPPKKKAESATMAGFTNILNRDMGAIAAQPGQGAFTGIAPGSIGVPRKQRPEFESTVAGLIPGDYEVQDAEAAMGARMAALRSGFTGNIRKALIDLGVTDTGKVGKFGSYIDADTIQQAAANKYSTSAQIAQQETAQRAKSEAALAARGILHSGQTTKTAGDIAAEGEKGRFAALQDFLSAGEQGLGNIAEEEYGLSQQVARARAAAAQRAAERYWWEWGGEEGEEAAGEGGMTDLVGGGYNPGTTVPAPKKPMTVAQAYKKLPAAVKKPQPRTPYGYASGYKPKKKK